MSNMKLLRFCVTNFRSVMDSGWIETDDITSLVGINEAGKSNIILALWKLNPARDGRIEPLHDMPVKEYTAWRQKPETIYFISADFELSSTLIDKVTSLCQCDRNVASVVRIKRNYAGTYNVTFPKFKKSTELTTQNIKNMVGILLDEISSLNEVTKSEAGIKDKAIEYFNKILGYVASKDILTQVDQKSLIQLYPSGIKKSATSVIYPLLEKMQSTIEIAFSSLTPINPRDTEAVRKLMVNEIPSFVYYSNYGNLDAQIYLPHAIKWLKGEEVAGIKNDAKVRTLRVLFDFVRLNPEEILELGKDPAKIIRDNYGRESTYEPTDEEINEATEKKTERTILLDSASANLTRKFREWWKQGNYNFRFQADGEFFKIWVSDDKRIEPIELERRSTGLQWFLSFYLVFLVESTDSHEDAILLLDEAGLSLHPLAQKDLVAFFDNLSKTNQIIHTTHSPFLLDTSNIDRVKVVYADDEGHTVSSSDLRASDDKLNEKSIYAVHAALGLSVSDILLQGCQPIIVEGPSDQHYLNAIKLYLIQKHKFTPKLELIFIPSGGVKGIPGVVSIVSGKDGDLPIVLLDADGSGLDAKRKLESGLYKDNKEQILSVGNFLSFENGEVEDLIPLELMHRQLMRIFRDVEHEDITDVIDNSTPIIPQIESFADKHYIELPKGWKVDLARNVKQQLLKYNGEIDENYVERWEQLFSKFA